MSPEMLAHIKRDVLFDEAESFMGLFSPEGLVVDANKAVLKMTGSTMEEVRNKPVWELPEFGYNPEVASHIKDAIAKAAGGELNRIEIEIYLKGQLRTHDIILKPIRNGQDAVVAVLAEGWDITERKRMEDKLSKNEHLYRVLARSAPAAVFAVYDKDLRFLLVEGELLAMGLGLTKEGTEGKTLYEVLPQEVVDKVEPYFKAALRGETQTVDYVAASEGIRGHALLLTYKPVINPDGTVEAGLLVAIDIEHLKRAERDQRQRIEELADLNKRLLQEVAHRQKTEESMQHIAKKLEESNQELQQFAYVASHDLQEPLRMVTSYLELLAQNYKGKLDDTANEFIDFAVDGAERMRQMIQDLLQYARIGTQGQEFAPVNLEELLQDVEQNLSVAIREAGGEITHDHLPEVYGDKAQLSRLLQNLISNAVKFRRKDVAPLIHIGITDKNDFWEISVKDNGIGIPENYLERIFQIFQRLHTREEYEGSGIGLAICKKIVERHGGEIRVESQEGQGSTFFFTLPKQPAEAAEPKGSPPPSPSPSSSPPSPQPEDKDKPAAA